MTATVVTSRGLNRAVLERQLLLERSPLPVAAAVERLLGLNAQDPNPPYVALWSRLDGFALEDLTSAIEDGTLVRSTMLRGTQHLVTAADFELLRPILAPLLRRVQRNGFGRRTAGVDLDALATAAREILAEAATGGGVMTRPELGRRLAERWPGTEASALGWSVQYLEPLVHPAPSGTWNSTGPLRVVLAEGTAVRREATAADVREMVRRYLAAFGPASVSDARVWSGVAGLREVFAELRPALRLFADESGRTLYDLPDAELPPADLPAPVRYVAAFDAPLLAYADRTRMMTDAARAQVIDGAAMVATVLVDGTVAATWSTAGAVLTVRPLRPLGAAERADVEAEGHALLAFASPASPAPDAPDAPDAPADVRILPDP